ncbi:MAG: hypothetical protein NC822_00455 [Candidatus Omnitrophica bacterium]|nr:hypothetical protein [Candidatus Omnitrophota bacterium]MCM8826014.1 hypothetical protein [Candidatus Omnitrophota bacterium]
MLRYKSSLSLIELILSMALLGAIILGAVSFDYASHYFLQSSERASLILNELNFILEHIHKNASRATGDFFNPGIISNGINLLLIRLDLNNPSTPFTYNDDIWVRYRINPIQANQFQFCANVNIDGSCNIPEEIISQRVVAPPIFRSPGGIVNAVNISNLTIRYDPGVSVEPRKNPEISIRSPITFTAYYSTN